VVLLLPLVLPAQLLLGLAAVQLLLLAAQRRTPLGCSLQDGLLLLHLCTELADTKHECGARSIHHIRLGESLSVTELRGSSCEFMNPASQ
jgi:hypothetical protein